jgi:hypothetical protein
MHGSESAQDVATLPSRPLFQDRRSNDLSRQHPQTTAKEAFHHRWFTFLSIESDSDCSNDDGPTDYMTMQKALLNFEAGNTNSAMATDKRLPQFPVYISRATTLVKSALHPSNHCFFISSFVLEACHY